MSASHFVHLHVHSCYSLLMASLRPDSLVDQAKQYGMPAVALTDHGNLFAAIPFYTRCLKAGIKPILGAQVYVVPDHAKHSGQVDREVRDQLILLCRNRTGWKNLLNLVSIGYLKGFYGKPRVDLALLARYGQGLIALSAGSKGAVGRLLLEGKTDAAEAMARQLADLFADDSSSPNFYLEVQRLGLPEHEKIVQATVELALRLNVPLVAGHDVHFLHPGDFRACDALRCIGEGQILEQENRPRLSKQQAFLSAEQMIQLFADLPEAISNTVQIARRCNLQLQLGKPILPEFQVPKGETLESWLRREAEAGLALRLEHLVLPRIPLADRPKTEKTYRERLDYELDVILQMGFPGYFLIVSDFIRKAKEKDIPVGPGRGSGAGSLAAWALQITDLDPIRYQLLFERFLNPERVSMPDFDVDFCQDRREEVIHYVQDKYGSDHVAQIITFGTMLAKGVIRDVGRVLGFPYGRVDRIAKLIPMTLGITLTQAIAEEDRLRAMIDTEPEVKELMDLALALEGLPRSAGTHAAGVVIANGPLTDTVPLYLDPRSSMPVTQFYMGDVEKAGLVKFDFLGLKTLTVIRIALDMVNVVRAKEGLEAIDILKIPEDDPETFRLLKEGHTRGVFQLESSGMREILKKLAPDSFEEIIALVALYRPGPLGSGMVDDFINRKHGRAQSEYLLPQLMPILKETYGVILYQEQVMKIAQVLAGYTLGGADLLRRAMGKKKKEEMAAQRATFQEGAARNHVDPDKTAHLFDLMEKFAEYGFNKSHSAAYALISYQTAWLKAHHPLAFLAATLTCDMLNTDKVIRFIRECREMGVTILPPDVNHSATGFIVEGNAIRYGLAAIKNVGETAIGRLVQEREQKGFFASLKDLCRRVDAGALNRRVLEHLIQSGACDSLHPDRFRLLAILPEAMSQGARQQQAKAKGIRSLFELEEEDEDFASAPESPMERPTNWTERLLADEKEALGFYLTSHPLQQYEAELAALGVENTLSIRRRYGPGGRDHHYLRPEREPAPEEGTRPSSRGRPTEARNRVVLAGIVADSKILRTRKGDRMAFITLEDRQGQMEAIIFPEVYQQTRILLEEEKPLIVTALAVGEGEEIKLQIEEIIDLTTFRLKHHRGLRLTIDLNQLTPANLDRLEAILNQYSGGSLAVEILLKLPNARALFRLGGSFTVHPQDALLAELTALFGQPVQWTGQGEG